MDEQNSMFNDAIASGMALADPNRVDEGGEYIVIPEKYKLEDLGHLRDVPRRTKQTVLLQTLSSFAEYTNRFKLGSTVIFADQNKIQLTAIIDYDQRDFPAWRDHKAVYICPKSPEWETWTRHNGKKMHQGEFAEFIEDNLPDVVEPPGAEMLEISRTLEAKKRVSFSSAVRLSNGDFDLAYQEEVKGTAQKGKIQIPDKFVIGISPFLGSDPYKIDARLRYRISDEGSLTLWYDLHRPHKIIEAAFQDVIDAARSATGITPYIGQL